MARLGPLFDYELFAVPVSLIDEQGCLRKGNKSALVKRLGVIECTLATADIVIVDVQQLLGRIVWPHDGSPSDVIESICRRLSRYPHEAEKIIVFDKYQDVSAKDHGRMQRVAVVPIDYVMPNSRACMAIYLGGNVALHGLIRHCMLIHFRKCGLHVF